MKNFADISGGDLLKLLEEVGGDGHSIYPKEFFIDKFNIPEEIIKYCEHTFSSDDSNPKSTIFKDGEEIKELTGVFCLDLHYRIAEDLGLQETVVKAARMQGRWFQAKTLYEGIKEELS